MNPIRNVAILLFACGLLSVRVYAQTNQPYTRYALGTLFTPEFTNLRGWGGLSAAYHSPFNINFANPASYSDIKVTTLDVAAFGSLLKITTKDTTAAFGDGSTANVALAFPVIKNKMGMSIGIIPYSRVNYSVSQANDSTPEFGQSFNLFQGKGGIYRFFVGGGYKIKQLSFGLNASYLFGTVNYTDILAFPDTVDAFNTRKQESRTIGDFLFDGGAQYRFTFGSTKNYTLDVGLSGSLKTNMSTKRNVIYDRFTYKDANGNNISTPNPYDTIFSAIGEKGDVIIPGQISGGAIFSKSNHYSVGANYRYAAWSQYRSFGEVDNTTDTWMIGIGGEFIPNYKSYQEYWKLMTYRLGFQYGTNYIQFEDKDLNQATLSIGAGFPLRRTFSQISIAGEWTHIGSLTDNPLTVSFFRLTAGFTLNDKWFQKRKFE